MALTWHFPVDTRKWFLTRPSGGRKCGSFPRQTTQRRWDISRRNFGGECSLSLTVRVESFGCRENAGLDLVCDALLDGALWHAAITILPVLAETANGFAQTDSEGGDGFEALLAAVRKLAIVLASNFGKQQFSVPENACERVVQFVTQCFAECFLIVSVQ